MLTTAFILGNGDSRKDIDLETLRGKGTIVGCNAIHRDFYPDVLVAVDQKMINEIQNSQFCKEGNYFITHTSRNSNTKYKLNFGKFNTSGCVAMKYAGIAEINIAYLLGLDCYGGNVYVNTPNYPTKNINPNRYKTFLRFFKIAVQEYPNTKYINIIKDGKDGLSKELGSSPNYSTLDMDEFLENLPKFPNQPVIKAHDESGKILFPMKPIKAARSTKVRKK